MITFVPQQRIIREGFTGTWNDMSGADTIEDAHEEIVCNMLALNRASAASRAEYRIVHREDVVVYP